jgi:hypothetical protein
MVRIWNYSKTPLRGASSLELWLDGTLLYAGELGPAVPIPAALSNNGIAAGGKRRIPRPCWSLLFTPDSAVTAAEVDARRIHYCGAFEQDVLCFNDGQLVKQQSSARAMQLAAASVKPAAAQRPATSLLSAYR